MKLTDYTQIGSEKMSTNIKVISKISQNIDKILKVIDIIEEISISTNILAMNASIEAAKSGKKGEGFSVIAEEIRNLSIYTSNNASDISEYLKQIVNEIQSVIFTGNESLESFNDINREVKSISAKFRIMDNNMKILKEKSTLLNSSIKDISAITNSIYDMSDELNRNSNDIKSYINKIKTSSNNINEEIINYNDRIIIINTSTKDILHFCESNNLNLYKINNEMQRLNKNLKPLDK